MEPINVNLSCDIQQPVKVRYLDGYFFSKDSAGHRINVDVFNNGVPVSVGGSVSAEVVRSDGETVPVTGAVSENRAYVILPQAAYAVVGAVQITIKVTEGTTIVTIACFVAYVHESDTEITVDPGTIIPSVQALISQIETAVTSIPADYSSLWTSLAPAFSSSTAYAVGQYVTNSGVLYRFTTAHPAGTWNSAHVTAVNLGTEVYNLKSAINAFEKEFVADDFVVNGGIAGSTGNTASGNTRLTSDYFTAAQRFTARTINGYLFYVFAWDGETYIGSYRNGTYVTGVGAQALSEFYFVSYPATYRFRICVKRSEGGEISLSEKTNVLFANNILGPDETMTVEGEAADAKAVGDLIYNTRDKSRVTPLPIGHYSTSGLDAIDFRDMPQNTYIYTTFAKIKAGLADTEMPETDWADSDYVYVEKSAIGSASTTNAVITLYNITKTRALIMLYVATSSDSYRWMTVGGTNSYTYNQYENTYTVEATPEITTDTNNYLQPSGDTTDMASAIVAMLTQTGVCNLAPGIFYVSGIDMPDDTMIRGSGSKTRIILLDSVSDGYAVKMGSRCIVEDCRIMGQTSQYTPTSTIGTRHGILWQGTATPETITSAKPLRGTISNCYISNFSGGGIYCQGTGTGISNCLNVVNVFVYDCTVGVYIPLLSEFNRFTNVDCRGCYYGSINNGGNNVFTNCGFSKNIVGIMIDNSNGQSTNSAHGTYNGCVFNHSGANNDGVALKLLGITAREIFTGCQIFFGTVEIENSKGIVINACNFGSSIPINITGGKTVLFTGCVFSNAPTITVESNTDTHFVNCYTGDGDAVTA